jgi:isoamylase
VTCHDGFTLNDLVSYNVKHNDANGENNRDGMDDDVSWNCGAEGKTDDPAIKAFRQRQIKNFAASLLLSQGVPMLLGGDETRRTQQGNNNAYCQDNEISWFDWNLAEEHADVLRFFKRMIAFRKSHPVLLRSQFFTGKTNARGLRDIAWHGCALNSPGWFDPASRILVFTLEGFQEDADLHVMLNMEATGLEFTISEVQGRRWYRAIDTARPAPDDIVEPGDEMAVPDAAYSVKRHSAVVLISKEA